MTVSAVYSPPIIVVLARRLGLGGMLFGLTAVTAALQTFDLPPGRVGHRLVHAARPSYNQYGCLQPMPLVRLVVVL